MEKKFFSLNKNKIIIYDETISIKDNFFNLDSNGLNVISIIPDIYDDRAAYIDSKGSIHVKGTYQGSIDPTPIPPSADFEIGMYHETTGIKIESSSSVRTIDYIEVSSDYKYTVKLPVTVVWFKFYFYDSNKNYIGCTADETVTTGTITTTPPSDAKYMTYKFSSEDLLHATALEIAKDVSLIEEKINIDEVTPVPSSVCETGSLNVDTGELKTSETSVRTIDFISVSNNNKYTINMTGDVLYFRFFFYDTNYNYLSCTNEASASGSISTTPPTKAKYMKFKFGSASQIQSDALTIAQTITIKLTPLSSTGDPGDTNDPIPTVAGYELGSFDSNTGQKKDSATSVRYIEYLSATSDYTYKLYVSKPVNYFRFYFFDSVKNYIGCTDDGAISDYVIAEPPSNAKYMRFKYSASDNSQATAMEIASEITIVKTKKTIVETPTPDPGTTNPGTGGMLYRFGMLADTHIDGDGNDESYSASDIKGAMSFLMSQNVSFICIAGDVSRNGTSKDYELVKKYLFGSSYNTKNVPVYCVTGNHDCMGKGTSGFKSATGCELNYVKEINGDVFIFASMSATTAASSSCYSSSTASWVKTQFSTYKNKRKFFITHPFIKGTCGNNGGTYHDNLNTSGNNKTIIDAVKAETKLIHISGHSHFLFDVTNTYANNNCYHKSGEPYYIHVPSNTRPRNASASNVYEKGEGYIVDVYKDKVVFRGFDSVGKAYKTSYVYTINLVQ